MGKARGPNCGLIPDARRINRELDILQVARALDIIFSPPRLHCWHPENHRNGDADPSVGHWEAANRLKCFVCGKPPIGVIDLVMDVRNFSFENALAWLASRFELPMMPVRKPGRGERRQLSAILHPIDYLTRSHIFSRLSPPAQAIATAMVALSNHSGMADAPRQVKISYRGLMRYTGIRSQNSVSKGISELELLGWLHRRTRAVGLLKDTGIYTLTPFAETIQELGQKLAQEEQMAIEFERAAAERRRAQRLEAFRTNSKQQGVA